MITFFTLPKSFAGHIGVIQNNAIESWKYLIPRCQVLLIGNEEGVRNAALRFGVDYCESVRKNAQGTPLLDSAFEIADSMAKHPYLCYVNSDIMFLQGIEESLNATSNLRQFVMVGRRTNLDIEKTINFDSQVEIEALVARSNEEGRLSAYTALDYFIFPRGTIEMKEFPVGRALWDNWVVWDVRRKNIPLVDATNCLHVVHQNHAYNHLAGGKAEAFSGEEVKQSWEMLGPDFYQLDIRDANYVIDSCEGLIRKKNADYYIRKCMTLPVMKPSLSPIIRYARTLYRLKSRILKNGFFGS